MPPDPPRGQGPPGLADWGPKGGDSNSPDSPEDRGKSRNVTLYECYIPRYVPGVGGPWFTLTGALYICRSIFFKVCFSNLFRFTSLLRKSAVCMDTE